MIPQSTTSPKRPEHEKVRGSQDSGSTKGPAFPAPMTELRERTFKDDDLDIGQRRFVNPDVVKDAVVKLNALCKLK